MIIVYEAVLALGVLALFTLMMHMLYILFFEHTHENGHCGYSGCQADLEEISREWTTTLPRG